MLHSYTYLGVAHWNVLIQYFTKMYEKDEERKSGFVYSHLPIPNQNTYPQPMCLASETADVHKKLSKQYFLTIIKNFITF